MSQPTQIVIEIQDGFITKVTALNGATVEYKILDLDEVAAATSIELNSMNIGQIPYVLASNEESGMVDRWHSALNMATIIRSKQDRANNQQPD